MVMKNKKKGMTREEAAELYDDLRKAMKTMKEKQKAPQPKESNAEIAKQIAMAIKQGMAKDGAKPAKTRPSEQATAAKEPPMDLPWSNPTSPKRGMGRGEITAFMFILLFAGLKVVVSALEASGILSVEIAQASYIPPASKSSFLSENYSKEEVRILTTLDERRKQLVERAKKLDEQEIDITRRDREFAAKLTKLRELTEQLKIDRKKSERKRDGQLEQLANVYGSMNPTESAELIEQLDVTIALSLIERMPEKRIGQILALMSPERALAITRMLSGGE